MTDNCSQHPQEVPGYEGRIDELVENLASLDYRVLRMTFDKLGDNILEQAVADEKRGRPQLSSKLEKLSEEIFTAEEFLEEICSICQPYVNLSKYPQEIPLYEGRIGELVTSMGNLDYQVLAVILDKLGDKLLEQADANESIGRPTLAKALEKTAVSIYQSVELLEKVCKICAPYMGKPK
ncbi:hypothetical protein KA107_03790 [Candidatus Pacearchaeota archaeon]|nr:hypothetical protein [Candidatus Pacearchaeota archaeon]